MKSNSKETNRIKETSIFAIEFANTVFVFGILFSVLIAVYSVYKIYNLPESWSKTFYYLFLLFALLFGSILGLGFKWLRDELKVNLSVLFITACISVFGFETYLEFRSEKSSSQVAELMGVPFDTRTKREVIEDLNDSGIKSFQNFLPRLLLESNGLSTSNGRIYPLGGISNITTILGNESGYYPVIETDEHGFNNPKGLYEVNKVDIILTGDSFTEGCCVHSDETISAVLRGLGFNVISIGKGGNGPLIELAALKEYAEPIKPKIVMWMYHTNDISNLKYEIKSTLLQKYFYDNEFSQNLLSRQEEFDSLLVDYIEKKWKSKIVAREKDLWTIFTLFSTNNRAFKILKLYNLRSMISLFPAPTFTPILKDILQNAKQMVSDWGGKMYFVYLPQYSPNITNNHPYREFLLKIETELDIPIIDIHREVFVPHPDPMSLFPLRMSAHYNVEGYQLVAESIFNRFRADGIIPLNSKN